LLRVGIVGSGPSGVYAADALTKSGEVEVDVLDRLPCPFGLVRYGVAPDHEKIRSIAATLRQVLIRPGVRFLGNVEVGRAISTAELHRFYDAVIYAHGAAVDRRLGVPGEDLPGSMSATDFVAWYCGHPDARPDMIDLSARSVVVIGVGNVAVDVVRILAKSADDLRHTDVPDQVLEALANSSVEDIYLVGRRGPAQAKFTTKELRELGELANADVILPPEDLAVDEASEETVESNATVRRNLEVLKEWSTRKPAARPRRIHVRFLLRPVELVGQSAVQAVRFQPTRLDGTGNVVDEGDPVQIDAQLVLRSVGYRGVSIEGVPFDERSGTIPNQAGRVLRDGEPVPGVYVTGWIKRGPTGVVGTNKSDAAETVASLLADAGSLPPAEQRDPDAIVSLLRERGSEVVTWDGWTAIEAAEEALGAGRGCPRVKLSTLEQLLEAARRAAVPAS
jgi:ferredoxin--NADP+ reductase